MRSIIIIVVSCLLLQACGETEKKPTKLQRLGWINGFWKMSNRDGSVTESWVQTDDTTFTGAGKYYDSAGNVLTSEEIRIVLRKKQLWYIPTVNNQNGGASVSFREVSYSDTMVVFENKGHDFPQRIGYIKKSDSTILAYIEGKEDGVLQRMEFPYSKQ